MVTGKSSEPERRGTFVRADVSPSLELRISVSAAGKPNKPKTLFLYVHPSLSRASEPSLALLLSFLTLWKSQFVELSAEVLCPALLGSFLPSQ